MKKYLLNYYVPDLTRFEKQRFNGQGWSISFEPADDHVENAPRLSRTFFCEDGERDGGPVMVVVIHAKDHVSAYKVARLITAAHCVIDGSVGVLSPDELLPYPADDEEDDEPDALDAIRLMLARKTGVCIDNTPLACIMAARASRCKPLVFAIFKLLLSLRMRSTLMVDLDPFLNGTTLPKARTPEECVTFAQAITLAYGAIEELGLEMRARGNQPTRPNGEWDPVRRTELEHRLRLARVDLSDPVLWHLRGPRTRLEQRRPTRHIGKAKWAYRSVRDENVHVCDAIADISWLRSKVAAHRSSELVEVLSPYDVANAQHLARRLILERLGIIREFASTPESAQDPEPVE